jgi:REP element-mobilizing transposase RayT
MGNNRADVFFDDEGRTTYLFLLKSYREKWAVEIRAYCLMTNHLHILAVPADEGSLSRCIGGQIFFIRSMSTGNINATAGYGRTVFFDDS